MVLDVSVFGKRKCFVRVLVMVKMLEVTHSYHIEMAIETIDLKSDNNT